VCVCEGVCGACTVEKDMIFFHMKKLEFNQNWSVLLMIIIGGQILFESLLEVAPLDADEACSEALAAMTSALADLFSGEVTSND